MSENLICYPKNAICFHGNYNKNGFECEYLEKYGFLFGNYEKNGI